MSYKVIVEEQFSKILRDPNLRDDLFDFVIDAADKVVVNKYTKQAPVDKGELRRGVRRFRTNFIDLSASVTTEARSDRGAKYPIFVHEGTGSMRGTSDQGYTSGRVRARDIAKGVGGIRPNKFAKRASEESEPLIVKRFKEKIAKLIKKR